VKVISTTCTVVINGTSSYGDATLENDSKAHWVASRVEGKGWSVSVTAIFCSQCNNPETIAAVKEAALAAIKRSEAK